MIISVTDHGMWRGHHAWTIVMQDDNGRSQVSARGDTEAQAIADAQRTFANRRIFSPEDKAALGKSSQALRRLL